MKNALTIALGIVLAAGIALPAAAQQAGPRTGGGQQQRMDPAKMQEFRKKMEAKREAIFKELKLTAAQITQIKAADKKMQDAMQKLRPQGQAQGQRPTQAQMQEMRTKSQAIRKTHTDTLVKIMTKPKHDQMNKRMAEEAAKVAKSMGIEMPRMGGGGPRGGGGGA
jgi:pyruvate dehydrogenase complex dehydrogenase (E1) component